MKSIKYLIATALCTCVLTACMNDNDDWDKNRPNKYLPAYGNNDIIPKNVITIAEFLNMYESTIENNTYKEIKEDIQIKGRVTGNDVEGNLDKTAIVQDETAAICIGINERGLWGYLPLGQEILIDLKGLYIGGYGKHAQIGVPYKNSNTGNISIGRLPRPVWEEHFKITGSINESIIEPELFTKEFQTNPKANASKLVILKNITFRYADGVKTLKDSPTQQPTGYFHQPLNEFDDNVVIFTSGDYAHFATWVMPYDSEKQKAIPCDITAIASYFNGTWQISIRQGKDIKVRK